MPYIGFIVVTTNKVEKVAADCSVQDRSSKQKYVLYTGFAVQTKLVAQES